jgi:sigma-B regulation protein RsbU (phosphoserine phosphatase)
MKTRKLRTILLIKSIVPSMVLITFFIALLIFSLFFIQKIIMRQAGTLGQSASDVSSKTLTEHLQDRAQQTSDDIAALTDEKLIRMHNFTQILADIASKLYTNRENYKPRIIPQYKPGEIPRDLEPVLNIAPGVSFARVRDEALMLSNSADILQQITNISSDIASAFIAAESGIVINIETTQSPVVSYDPHTRPWYAGARDESSQTGVFWSDIYVDVRGRGLALSCSAPVYDQSSGKKIFVGVAGCSALIADFSHLVENSSYIEDDAGDIFLLDGTGLKVFASDGTGIHFDENNTIRSENYLESSDENVRALARRMTQQETGVMTLELNGEKVDVSYHPLHEINWSVGVIYKHSTITMMVDPLQNQILNLTGEMERNTNNYIYLIAIFVMAIGIVVILIRVGLVYRLANYVTGPISELVAEAEAISSGDLDAKAHVSSGTQEIEQLAHSFNDMKARLREYIETLATATAEKERISTELIVATKIQTDMLTNKFPPYTDRPNHFDLFASMRPAKEVGGDFYDFFFVDDNHFAFVIADVAGKGVPAALLMVVAKTLIKSQLLEGVTAKVAMERVNNDLCENNIDALFVTIWIGLLDLQAETLEFVNAGHNPPLLKSGNFGVRFLKQGSPDLVAGIEKNIQYQSRTIALKEGDLLVLYTDGITEAFDASGSMYGEERLTEFINKHHKKAPKELIVDLQSDVTDFAGNAEQSDDMTLLAIKMMKEAVLERRTIKVNAHIASLNAVLSFVTELSETVNCPDPEKQQIELAVEELFVNIASYAYDGSEGDAEITVIVRQIKAANNKTEMTIIINDTGKQFNPLLHDDPDVSAPLDEREPGGLGLFLVKKTMNSVKYNYSEGHNQTTIIKTWECI